MTEREDKVYKAKLAEQAERYDGKCIQFKVCASIDDEMRHGSPKGF